MAFVLVHEEDWSSYGTDIDAAEDAYPMCDGSYPPLSMSEFSDILFSVQHNVSGALVPASPDYYSQERRDNATRVFGLMRSPVSPSFRLGGQLQLSGAAYS